MEPLSCWSPYVLSINSMYIIIVHVVYSWSGCIKGQLVKLFWLYKVKFFSSSYIIFTSTFPTNDLWPL